MAYMNKLGLFAAPLALAGMTAGMMTGCGEGTPGVPGVDELIEQCGLTCAADGVAEGNFALSGVAGVDAFFGSVVRFETAASQVNASIRAELDGIALSLGLEKGASAAEIKAALDAKIEANVEGSLEIKYAAPKCEISASVTAEATAKCDASVDAGEV